MGPKTTVCKRSLRPHRHVENRSKILRLTDGRIFDDDRPTHGRIWTTDQKYYQWTAGPIDESPSVKAWSQVINESSMCWEHPIRDPLIRARLTARWTVDGWSRDGRWTLMEPVFKNLPQILIKSVTAIMNLGLDFWSSRGGSDNISPIPGILREWN